MRPPLCRLSTLASIVESRETWDVVVIGGGATGLGAAVDSASRGFRTLLFEQSDFAKATSSRSTKLIHGGVRYLKQGNLPLVREALLERSRLLRNAPHIVKPLPFVVPGYQWQDRWYYGVGLKMYDWLAGLKGIARSKILSRKDTLLRLGGVKSAGLRGGVLYYDAQFDDARLAMSLVQTVFNQGGKAINYMRVESIVKDEDHRAAGLVIRDLETGNCIEVRARAVINATGIFTDEVRQLDAPDCWPVMKHSQGVHVVLDREVLEGESALMIPETDDGRVLFAIPWNGRVIVGTTDTAVPDAELEPQAREAEIDYLLEHVSRYLEKAVSRSDVRSVFVGIRPLVSNAQISETSQLSREHRIIVSASGMVSIAGGKWTTYRKMAEDVVNKALEVSGLIERPCRTSRLRLHGGKPVRRESWKWEEYGSDAVYLDELVALRPELDERLHPGLPLRGIEVLWAVRYEMARTLEDVLSRRTRCLLFDARASIEVAPKVAKMMADELGEGQDWIENQEVAFRAVAEKYLVEPSQGS